VNYYNAVMTATDTLAAQLKEIFGNRLKMVASFGADANTCAIVESLTVVDLDRCAGFSAGWARLRLNTPLFLQVNELARGRDAFPLEFNEIIATRHILLGPDLFAGMTVPPEDLRRACEVQARGHLLHLREGYIEAAGSRRAIDRLVSASLAPFRSLVSTIARFDGCAEAELLTRLGISDVEKGFSESLRAAERLVEYVDRWGRT
jgi:hypothetical protein